MDWHTPSEILDLVRQVDEIGLDPATTDENPVGASEWTSQAGLEISWRGHGLVWCNPPYGRVVLPKWTAKAATEFGRRVAGSDHLIMLVPARTDTRWFRNDIAASADSLCFWSGRIRFVGAKAGAPFPSLLAYWGNNRRRFEDVFDAYGWIP